VSDIPAPAPVAPPRALAWAQALVLAGLLGAAYARVAASLWETWSTNDNYSHGPLVPLVSLALVWLRWPRLRVLEVRPARGGLWLLAAGCLMLVLGVRMDIFALQGWSLLVVLFGLTLAFFGVPVLRMLAFPILYLAFMLTFPPVVMNTLSFALKSFATAGAAGAAQLLGVAMRRDGMQIYFASGELSIENPCSGLRSLLALLATGTLFAYFQRGGAWRRAAVMLAAIPIALAGNMARLLLLFIASDRKGVDWATGRFHDVTGYIMYAVALGLLVALRGALTPRAARGTAR
jgi:exosortase